MIYFDTAYLVKCYINEAGSNAVRSLARRHGRIACCEFGRLELHAAFHRNFRDGMIDRAYLDVVTMQFEVDEQDHLWYWLPLTRDIMGAVIEAFQTLPSNVYLRTADAIHLCCAREHELQEIHTNDTHLLHAAQHFDLVGKNVI